MKIVNSIKQLYNEEKKLNELVAKEANKLIRSILKPHWHFLGRLKSLESYALKLETGRVSNPQDMEDFYACTIVVENSSAIAGAKALIKKHFQIHEERPKNKSFTHKDSASFIFDDLRLYVTIKPTAAKAKGPINQKIFEIQVKTFLQHAWAIATHDLIYKSDEINWTRQRVAYQVKALLENAEISIARAEKIKRLKGLPHENEKVKNQNQIKEFLLRNWQPSRLPSDIIRTISNIENLLSCFNIRLDDLQNYLDNETGLGRGTHTLNLSPYLTLVQSLIYQAPNKVKKFAKTSTQRKRILLPSEIDVTGIADCLPSERLIRY